MLVRIKKNVIASKSMTNKCSQQQDANILEILCAALEVTRKIIKIDAVLDMVLSHKSNSLMNDISLGKFTFNIGLILRDSIFHSKMLLNSEVWHSVTKYQIEELEVIDRMLVRHTLNAHRKTALE